MEKEPLTQDSIYRPIDEPPTLNDGEKKAMFWFLSYGRACITTSFLLSIPSCLILLNWAKEGYAFTELLQNGWDLILVGVWIVFTLLSVIYSAPIIYYSLVNLISAFKDKSRLKKAELLSAVFFGWDRYFRKKGRPRQGIIMIEKPEDLLSEALDKQSVVRIVTDFFNRANNLSGGERKSYRSSLYRGVFDALEKTRAIKDQYRSRYESYSEFLSALGEEYKCSEKSLRKSPQYVVIYDDKRTDYGEYVEAVVSSISG